MLNRRGPISRLVGGGIGLAQEYKADRRARKDAEADKKDRERHPQQDGEHQDQPPSYSNASGEESSSSSETDDEAWVQALDEAQLTNTPQDQPSQDDDDSSPSSSSNNNNKFDMTVFLSRHPAPPQPPVNPLALPVIIPQRRPSNRTRGFVRAYAPDLGHGPAGITQDAWLAFLAGLDASIASNPWFHVANAAIFVADKVNLAVGSVSLVTSLVTMAVHVSLEGARRGYVHYRQNTYLDAMNDKFFVPRGLFCLIVKYKPQAPSKVSSSSSSVGETTAPPLYEEVDVTTHSARAVDAGLRLQESGWWRKLVSGASSTTRREEEEMPFAAAPLVFPGLDDLDDAGKEGAVAHFGSFMRDYYDRRAQAEFEAQHPDGRIPTVPRKEFASRFADPNHAASKGGLISIASGGKYNPVGPVGRIRGRMGRRREARGGEVQQAGGPGSERGGRRAKGRPSRRLMKQDALYLMVVNMPSQEELAAVRAQLERAGG